MLVNFSGKLVHWASFRGWGQVAKVYTSFVHTHTPRMIVLILLSSRRHTATLRAMLLRYCATNIFRRPIINISLVCSEIERATQFTFPQRKNSTTASLCDMNIIWTKMTWNIMRLRECVEFSLSCHVRFISLPSLVIERNWMMAVVLTTMNTLFEC